MLHSLSISCRLEWVTVLCLPSFLSFLSVLLIRDIDKYIRKSSSTMTPRGRSRKVGTSRISAAIDAMRPIGFGVKQVRSAINKLLREYGGVDGYPFIEDDAYKVLLDALLEKQEEEKHREDSTQDDSSNDQRVGDDTAGPSGGNVESSNSHPVDTHLETELAEVRDVNREEGPQVEMLDLPAEEGLYLLASCACSSEPQANSSRRHRPCYGWIEDRDDDDGEPVDWALLQPAVDESLS